MNERIKLLGKKVNEFLIDKFELTLRESTRHSTVFAKEYFKNKEIIAIEIGSYKGFNAKSILRNLNVKKIYLIDPWEEYEEYKNSEKNKNQKHLSLALKKCKKRLRKFSKKIEYIKNFSERVVNIVPEADFIYIDGNHEYPYVKRDIENYYKKLRDGGIIAGHDINWRGDTPVMFAVREFCDNNRLRFRVSGEDWWIVKEDKLSEYKK